MSFENLKRNRANISKLIQAAESVGGGGEKKSYADDRIWKPVVDKAGNGYAVLRFLPAAEGAELPWVRYWDHGFKGPTGLWYIERSLTSIGQNDPVGELNSKLWNTGMDADKDTARTQKRRLHYVANVLVVSNPSNPENEGKVFLYQFGKKIFDKIMDVMQPDFADEEPINPFDMWEGADFKLKIRNVEGYRNYDKSEFAEKRPIDSEDAKLEAIYGQMYDLNEFQDPKNYKTYSELQTKLHKVLGMEASAGAPSMAQERIINDPVPAPEFKSSPMTAEAMSNGEEDTLSYFSKLANDE
jgi:hypothetical protein|tara:strand:- start:558 stop:1454 length:897 start_codon:yes stop_codon:yes gene_type:complete